MKNLEQRFSEDLLVTQSWNSVIEYSDSIPYDLLVEIFSRVPAKFVCRFRCVSKSWRSIPRLPYFTELFLTKSLTRPRVLFVIKDDNKDYHVFSSPQPQNNHLDGEDYSLVATRYNNFPKHFPSQMCSSLCGLVCLHGWTKGINGRLICNPITGESIILPRLKAKRSYFGYDPISKQLKVLCMIYNSRYRALNTHLILTLGTGERVWRSTTECKPHESPEYTGICIDGVLYYRGHFKEGPPMMVCFDFSSEKFSFIKMHKDMLNIDYGTKLMNYKGKLCAVRDYRYQELWVLEDAGEHKWSKTKLRLPIFCGANIRDKCYIVGITGAGEIVFQPYGYPSNDPCFYLVFYNMERNTFTRVDIHGLEEFKHRSTQISTFLDYVETMTTLV